MLKPTLKQNIKVWANQFGSQEAVIKLLQCGFSPRFAEQLVNGTYKHRVRASTLRRLERAMNG